MDDPFSGDERQHKSWRDLPPTPPLVWPTATPAFATAAIGPAASPMPTAGASRRTRRRFVVGTALLVGAVAVVGTGMLATGNQVGALLAPLAAAGGPAEPDKAAAAIPPSDEPLADTASRLLPSVVQIEADGAVGSGFVAADGGLILTASHVVGRSDTVTLRLSDGTSVSGVVVAVDKSVDTAVIRAEESAATGLKPIALGALADVQVGEMTIAVGSPFGLSQTVTTGIVSALGRTVPTPMGELHDLIQTDAAINSGNSGGPLADREGRAIGINTAIASASGGSDGIGFAVPIDQAARILDKVKDGTWKAEDNDPADGKDSLGGLFDQFLGPDGLNGLRDLFGLRGPDGSQTPNGPSGSSDMADRMLRQLLDEFMRELAPGAPAPQPAPGYRAGSGRDTRAGPSEWPDSRHHRASDAAVAGRAPPGAEPGRDDGSIRPGWRHERHGSMTVSIDLSTTRLAQVRHELGRVIVGQDRVVDRLLVAVLAEGHVLLEGAPGLGKTLLLSTLARILGGSFNRIQFTPDLIPSDIVGTRIFRPSSEAFDVEPGPIIANVVLVDEINRAPARVQSALLEAMAERQVTVGGRTFAMPKPFLVVATQNPVESEGVYPLAEAQRDRFLMRIPVDYPTPSEERAIVARMADEPPQAARLLDPADVVDLQLAARRVAVDDAAADYAIRLVLATRDPAAHGLQSLLGLLEYGASPRASLGLVRSARAMALLRGRMRAVAQDVYDVAYDILNARLALSYRALAEGFTIDDVLVELLTTVPAPGTTAWPLPTQVAPPIPTPQTQSWQPMPGPVAAASTSWGVSTQTPPIVLPGDPPAAR